MELMNIDDTRIILKIRKLIFQRIYIRDRYPFPVKHMFAIHGNNFTLNFCWIVNLSIQKSYFTAHLYFFSLLHSHLYSEYWGCSRYYKNYSIHPFCVYISYNMPW